MLAAGAFLFPAFMVILAVQNSLLAALNPLHWAAVIRGAGPAYVLACLVLAAATASAMLLAGNVALAPALFIAGYTLLMVCHLLGFVAFHRGEQLGLSVPERIPPEERRRREQQDARLAALLEKLDLALGQKNLQAAADALYAEPGGPANVLLFHEELFQQCERRRNAALIHAQGARLITLLCGDRKYERALDICEACFDADRRFEPESEAQLPLLAQQALASRRDALFERITGDIDRRYPGKPVAVTLNFLTARYWYERHGDEGKARALVAPLLAAHAHPHYRQISAFARALGVPR